MSHVTYTFDICSCCSFMCDISSCCIRHIEMSFVTYKWVMSHMNESCHVWMSHVTYEWVMSQIWMSHVTYERVMSHMNESCHRYEWVMSYMSCQIWISIMLHTSYMYVHIYIYIMQTYPHVCISSPTHLFCVQIRLFCVYLRLFYSLFIATRRPCMHI